jgi:hypothetical protein
MKNRILNVLLQHRGEANSIRSYQIGREARVYDRDPTSYKVRACIRELIDEGVPIGSGPDGYYIMATTTELQLNIAALSSRISSMTRRRDNLIKAFNEFEE